jgi:hypothetical protein
MRRTIELGLLAATLFATLHGDAAASVEVGPDVRLFGATAEQVDLGRWAVRRFEDAGLQAPAVEIHFHADLSGCRGNLGYALAGRVDLCTPELGAVARRAILHEMGHVWLDAHTTPPLRARFDEMRGLRGWNVSADPWRMRGYEQGAEVLAWGLGDRIITPSIPDNDYQHLCESFRFLTGVAPPPGGWVVS